MSKHNHITRDIKSLGECPSCDEHHYRNRIKTATPQELLENEAVRELVELAEEMLLELPDRVLWDNAKKVVPFQNALKKFEVKE